MGDQLDLFGRGSFLMTPGLGFVNLLGFQMDSAGDFDTLQAGSFVLVGVTLDTLLCAVSAWL